MCMYKNPNILKLLKYQDQAINYIVIISKNGKFIRHNYNIEKKIYQIYSVIYTYIDILIAS